MRKERIPVRLVQDFGEAVVHLPDGASAIAEVGRRGEGDGIGCMHDYLVTKLVDANISESSRGPLTTLLGQLESGPFASITRYSSTSPPILQACFQKYNNVREFVRTYQGISCRLSASRSFQAYQRRVRSKQAGDLTRSESATPHLFGRQWRQAPTL
ncbi:hypothetical protein B0J13DRAFT_564308 [Dactylonectria estremocensis]|uniref:Uncharacterized protein n=1 Tax=Dactylonectria estremocensis TaxID=1079267 RepID=A0A9P9DZW5_9HYPO|nr:hypothetical protein B0J13DRAFT_564308 [Dactylonectria estremocensis]